MERKLVVVKTSGVLPELDMIYGPILRPTRIPIDKVVNLVLNGRIVYECCPNHPTDKEKWVRLTKENVKQVNFGSKPKVAVVSDPTVHKKVAEIIKESFKEDSSPQVEIPDETTVKSFVDNIKMINCDTTPGDEPVEDNKPTSEKASESEIVEEQEEVSNEQQNTPQKNQSKKDKKKNRNRGR